MTIQPGRVIAGRYRLEHLLGEGGMGQVWVARHTNLSRMVAVKLMTEEAHASSVMRARFEREAKACGQLRSPHVVQVFDYGVEDDMPYLVMELLEGEDLSSLREARPIWPLADVAHLIAQAAKGLAEAHELGIVHRDIKLSNLFIARVGGQSVLKILDFGIAKTFEQQGPQMTGTNVQMGSPNYMSPEQVMSKAVDGRADLWALGVVAYRLLTGEPPFRGEASILVAQKIILGQRLPATEVADGLPREIDAFFDRALALLPDDRFQTAGELAKALAAISSAHPGLVARPRAGGAPRASPREEATAREQATGAERSSSESEDPAFADTAAPDRLLALAAPPGPAPAEPTPPPTDFNATIPIAASSPLIATAPRRIEATLVSASSPVPKRGPATTPLLVPGSDSSFARTLAMAARSPFASSAPERSSDTPDPQAPARPRAAPRVAEPLPLPPAAPTASPVAAPAFDPSDLATSVLPRQVPRPVPAAPRARSRQGLILAGSAVAIAVSVATVWWALGQEDRARDAADRGPTSSASAAAPAPPVPGDLAAVPSRGETDASPPPSVVSSSPPAGAASPSPSASASVAPAASPSAARPGSGPLPRPPPTAAPGPTRPPDDILDTAR